MIRDLDAALLVAQAAEADALAALVLTRAARPRVRLVAACELLPERACSCGRALVVPGRGLCDVCTVEEDRDREVLAERALAEPGAAVRPAPPRLARHPARRRLAVGGR